MAKEAELACLDFELFTQARFAVLLWHFPWIQLPYLVKGFSSSGRALRLCSGVGSPQAAVKHRQGIMCSYLSLYGTESSIYGLVHQKHYLALITLPVLFQTHGIQHTQYKSISLLLNSDLSFFLVFPGQSSQSKEKTHSQALLQKHRQKHYYLWGGGIKRPIISPSTELCCALDTGTVKCIK